MENLFLVSVVRWQDGGKFIKSNLVAAWGLEFHDLHQAPQFQLFLTTRGAGADVGVKLRVYGLMTDFWSGCQR